MIGGPDLAKSNLDLHELFFFLSRRLRELFVTDRRSLTVHLAAIDEHADPDERYRINEYFCSDDMWQEAVEQLVGHCDAVLLDLRDFSAERRGTTFEIELLARRGALRRTVFMINGQTDMKAWRKKWQRFLARKCHPKESCARTAP